MSAELTRNPDHDRAAADALAALRALPDRAARTHQESTMSAQPVASVVPAVASASAFGVPTFTKHDAAGELLPVESSAFAFVRVSLGEHAFDMLPGNVGDGELTFEQANDACAAITIFGGGWRLPTRRELLALVDDTRWNPAVDRTFFSSIQPSWYWTSTVDASSPAFYAWGVSFSYGHSYDDDQNGAAFARAVRSVPRASQ